MLDVTSIEAGYNDLQVLWGPSITVASGEVVGIVGPNGAGKSTVLNCIAGLLKTRSGHIRFGSVDCTNLPAHRRVALGLSLVLERRRLFPGMTVRENLLLGAYAANARKQRDHTLAWVLDLFPPLKSRLGTPAHQLSGGQQQMVAIGRGLMSRPRLLMVDEPYIGLAPDVMETVAGVFQELRQQEISVLFVEHHVELTIEISDRLYVMSNGQVAFTDGTDSVGLRERVRNVYFGDSNGTARTTDA